MKSKLVLATVAAVGLLAAGSAGAADLARPVYKAPPPPPPPVYSWTGCYLDAGVGYGMWNQVTFEETLPGPVPVNSSIVGGGRGWLGRFGGGCDYQFVGPFGGNWVIGAFADYDTMSLKPRDGLAPFSIATSNINILGSDEKESSAWYVGGRIGWVVFPQLLTYVNAGYTETRFDQQNVFVTTLPPVPFGAIIPATTFHGWFVGSGYEYVLPWFSTNWSTLTWKTEYRYASYRAQDLPFILTPGGVNGDAVNSKKFVQTVTSSLVWRFNWGGPGYARY